MCENRSCQKNKEKEKAILEAINEDKQTQKSKLVSRKSRVSSKPITIVIVVLFHIVFVIIIIVVLIILYCFNLILLCTDNIAIIIIIIVIDNRFSVGT